MNNKKMRISVCMIIVLILLLLIIPVLPFDKWYVIKCFNDDRIVMDCISKGLINSSQTDIYINAENIYTFPELADEQLIDKLKYLLNDKNYLYIEKYKDSVFFCKKAKFGNGLGIAYVSGYSRIPKSRMGVFQYEKIDTNWFYCSLD